MQIDRKALERLGAEVRIEQLQTQIGTLKRLLAGGSAPVSDLRRSGRRKPSWSAARRRAVAVRMKKYWTARRKGKKAA